jgi:hypothetical protein
LLYDVNCRQFCAGVVKSADTADLSKLSARRETGGVELLKVGETLNGNPEPSPEVFGKV